MALGMTNIEAKVERLLATGAVTEIHDRVYAVRGDHDTYLVTIAEPAIAAAVGAPWASCTCRASRGCTHILAAGESLKLKESS